MEEGNSGCTYEVNEGGEERGQCCQGRVMSGDN